jgi:hypothetical protein
MNTVRLNVPPVCIFLLEETLSSSLAILYCKLQLCNEFFLDRLAARALAKASKDSLNNVEWAWEPTWVNDNV